MKHKELTMLVEARSDSLNRYVKEVVQLRAKILGETSGILGLDAKDPHLDTAKVEGPGSTGAANFLKHNDLYFQDDEFRCVVIYMVHGIVGEVTLGLRHMDVSNWRYTLDLVQVPGRDVPVLLADKLTQSALAQIEAKYPEGHFQ